MVPALQAKDSSNFQLIFAGEYTKAMNKDWHSDHFCCWQCDQTLTGQRLVMVGATPTGCNQGTAGVVAT